MPAITAEQRGRFRQVVGFATFTGAVTGLAVAGFEWLTRRQLFDRVLEAPLGIQLVAPLCGLLLAALALRYVAGGASSATSEEYIRNFHDPAMLDLRPVPGRMAASVATAPWGACGVRDPAACCFLSSARRRSWAGYRVPLAGVVFVAETTGRPGFIVPGLIATMVAHLFMGRASVSAYQKRTRGSPSEE